jgi:HD-like signal output (HDOD) protein
VEIRGLDPWLQRLEKTEGVGLTGTVQKLNHLTASDKSSSSQLAEVILKDGALTTQVIKVANSVYFNPSQTAIATVSRAIFHIGFNTIKSICVSIKVLETMLKENPSTHMVHVMASSLHGAIQARNLCQKMKSETKEEIFVTSMLFNLAEMLVLSTSEENVIEMENLYTNDTSREDKDRLAEKHLGVSLSRLSSSLSKKWRLGDTLIEALHPSSQPSSKAQAVILGDKISFAAKKGWNSEEFKSLLKELTVFTGLEVKDLHAQVMESANEAVEVAIKFGNKAMVSQIPSSKAVNGLGDMQHESVEDLLQPDQELQLKLLQELGTMIMQGADMNAIFQMILEGLHRGVGLERAVLAIFDKNRDFIEAKYAIGNVQDGWKEKFRFRYFKGDGNFFFSVFKQNDCVQIRKTHSLYAKLSPDMKAVIGVTEFLVAPLSANDRQIGVIYADLGKSKRALTTSYLAGFKHFVMQANMALAVIASKSKSKK